MPQVVEKIPLADLGFVTVEQAAAALPIKGFVENPTLPVKRLIARRVLPAVQVGTADDSPWRISLDALRAYIGRGAPDLQPPEGTQDGWPCAVGSEWRAGQFVADVIEALADQVPDDARAIPIEGGTTPEVALKVTAAIRAIITAPSLDRKPLGDDAADYAAAIGKPLPPKPEWSTFQNIGQLYLVQRMRVFAKWQAGMIDPARLGGLAFLYSSPTAYKAVLDGAGKAIANGKIVFSKWYPAQTTAGRPTQVQVQFTLADSAIMQAAGTDLATLAGLAF